MLVKSARHRRVTRVLTLGATGRLKYAKNDQHGENLSSKSHRLSFIVARNSRGVRIVMSRNLGQVTCDNYFSLCRQGTLKNAIVGVIFLDSVDLFVWLDDDREPRDFI